MEVKTRVRRRETCWAKVDDEGGEGEELSSSIFSVSPACGVGGGGGGGGGGVGGGRRDKSARRIPTMYPI